MDVKGAIRESTFQRYETLCHLRLVPALGRIKPKDLDSAQIRCFHRDRLDDGLSPAKIHKLNAVLHKALATAV